MKTEEKTKSCPLCGYDMTHVIVRKGNHINPKIHKYKCSCCGHHEKIETSWERAVRMGVFDYQMDNPFIIDKMQSETADKAERLKSGRRHRSNGELI